MNKVKIPLPVGGVDLLSEETSLPVGYVRRAENVDILRSGAFRRRHGHDLLQSGVGYHSMFASSRGVLLGRGSTLYALNHATGAQTALCDMGGDGAFDAVEYNGHTYVVNSTRFVWVPDNDSTARDVGVSAPNPLPDVVAHETGTLTPGKYAVAISRVDARGEESPTKLLGTVQTAAGVRLTGLHVEAGVSYRVYLSPNHGEVLYQAAEFAAAFTDYVVGEIPDGAVRTTQHLAPMPPGDFVRWHNGRIYVARGDTLHFSQPLRPHLTDMRHDFMSFVGLRFVEPVKDGIYVGDNRGVWFLSGGDPTQFNAQKVSPATPMRRSSLVLDSSALPQGAGLSGEVAVWLSTAGYMVGSASGQVIPLNPDRVLLAATLEGRSRFIVRDGVKQIITLVAASSTPVHGISIDTIQ